jgi:hypothetical protein
VDNTAYYLDGGALFTAFEAIARQFVHIRADGKIEVARNTVDSKPADGYVTGSVAANGTTQVFGTGARFATTEFGLVGVPSTLTRLHLADGIATLSTAGTGRLIQEVAIARGGFTTLTFSDRGYFIAAI